MQVTVVHDSNTCPMPDWHKLIYLYRIYSERSLLVELCHLKVWKTERGISSQEVSP